MKKTIFTSFILSLILAACSTSKNIPEGEYLLDNIVIQHDTKNVASDLQSFVRQQPNSSLPIIGRVRLKIFNFAGSDTSKWVNRAIRKLGEPPVLYNSRQAFISAGQIQKELNNQGYLNAEVDTATRIRGQKISVIYKAKGNTPYLIRNYQRTIEDTTMMRILSKSPVKPLLNKGDMFDMKIVEEERTQISSILRNAGYFNFSKEFIFFKADTTLNSHEVDLFLTVHPTRDSLPYPRYRLNNITIISGFNAAEQLYALDPETNTYKPFTRKTDTTDYKGLKIIRGYNKFLRSSTIYRNNYLKKGAYFSDMAMTRTFESYNKMGATKQVNIVMTPAAQDSTRLLDATVTLLPANVHWFKANLDGTNSAGDFGIAPSVTYQHQNLFNGAEQLNIRLKGAYEFINNTNQFDLANQNFYEFGVDAGLTFPLFLFVGLRQSWRDLPSATTRFSVGLNNQHRPEYTRQFFNLTATYSWMTHRGRLRHWLDLMDINYVRMPWVSDLFRIFLNNANNPLLQISYNDQLIARTAYTLTIANGRQFNPLSPTYNIRITSEIAGVVPRLISTINNTQPNEQGIRQLLGVDYAEYIKGGVDYSRTFRFSKIHSLAYHTGFGIAYPYGNSGILPFERRFFAGGPNSIRGWNTRGLGPGAYQGGMDVNDFANQTGDIRLEMSIEDRHKVNKYIELAGFIDAGNIWTIKKYSNQPGGLFQFSTFYKEIAVAYGLGIRFDMGIILLRLDTGIRAYDPGLNKSQRVVLFEPRLSRMALLFGIGYPF